MPAPERRPRGAALDLDGFFGLHPALEPLLPLWHEGALAVVHAVGSPDPTRSHFDAQDFMESGTPGRKATEDGWMNRCLQAQPDAGGHAVPRGRLTPTLPRSLAGTAPAVAMRAALRTSACAPRRAGSRGFEACTARRSGRAARRRQETFEAIDFLKKADPARYAPGRRRRATRAERYGDGLKQVAQLIKADVGLELAFTEIGRLGPPRRRRRRPGPAREPPARARQALAAFRARPRHRVSPDVVLVTLTEFGRTARENGNRGTDHGHGSVAFVMGGDLAGGKVHGRWPGLGNDRLYEGRDLAVTTDFRDLLARSSRATSASPTSAGSSRASPSSPEARFPGVLRA